MTSDSISSRLSRRALLGGTALTLLPLAVGGGAALAASNDFRTELEALAGYAPLPEPVVQALSQLTDGNVPREASARKDVLTALYTGLMPKEGGHDHVTYSDALMFVACRDTNNTPSFCGGVPGFWAEKPEVA